jgi:hypothetical protein
MNDDPRDRDRERQEVREIARADQEQAKQLEEAAQEVRAQRPRMGDLLDELDDAVAQELEVNPAAINEIRDGFESLLGEMIDSRRAQAADPRLTAEQRECYRQSAVRLDAALADFQADFPAAEDEDDD